MGLGRGFRLTLLRAGAWSSSCPVGTIATLMGESGGKDIVYTRMGVRFLGGDCFFFFFLGVGGRLLGAGPGGGESGNTAIT